MGQKSVGQSINYPWDRVRTKWPIWKPWFGTKHIRLSSVENPCVRYVVSDPVIVSSTIIVHDGQSPNAISATVTISTNYVEGVDVLSFVNTGTITGSFDAPTGVLTLTGVDTIENYQAALRSVTFTSG